MEFSKQTKIYIAGCGGMLGEAVYAFFSSICNVKATDIDLNEPWLSYADVRDFQQMSDSIREFNPDVIMNLAALTDLECCENDTENTWLTNALGAENVGLIASQLDIPLVYIGTAGIFNGKQDEYNDFEEPDPLCCYARAKYYGEQFVRQYVRKHYVVRAGWMMGGGIKKDKKFINKIYKKIVSGEKVLNVVDDKLGTPTYTVDFAGGLLKLLESDLYGLYNQGCGGSGSRYDVALEFIKLLGLENEIRINKVSSDIFKEEYFAPRPESEKLVNLKLTRRGLNIMRDWKTCLNEYSRVFIEDLKAGK